MCELRLENIHAAYRKKEVLRGVSLAVAGEITAIIGLNGAGKSTLLRVIAGFLRPTCGQVSFRGEIITTMPAHTRASRGMAYVMQGGRVFPSLTVGEHLGIGAFLLPADERSRQTDAVLDFFPALRTLHGRRAGLLSGGERQSLAIAMMLVRRPEALLLDEPSAGLSPKLVREMLEGVRNFNIAYNATTLLVEQNVQEALNIAHRAVALTNGVIALETTQPKTWLADGQLEQLYLGRVREDVARV